MKALLPHDRLSKTRCEQFYVGERQRMAGFYCFIRTCFSERNVEFADFQSTGRPALAMAICRREQHEQAAAP
jgi:hypothetical protein